MPSTFTDSLRLVKQAAGENNQTWGTLFNQQFADLIDIAIAGYLSISMADTDTTLTVQNGASDQSRYAALNFTGTLTAARNIIVPTTSKLYVIKNSTTGGFALTIKTSAGSGVSIDNGFATLLLCDGTNVISAISGVSGAVTSQSLTPGSYLTGSAFNGSVARTFAVDADTAATASKIVARDGSGNTAIGDSSTVGSVLIGYRSIPQNSQSADYTLVLTDSGKHVYHPGADTTPRTWTIPANASVAYPVGTAITFINDTSAGSISIAITSDTLILAGPGTTGTRTLAASGCATAVKMTSTRWIISGTGLS